MAEWYFAITNLLRGLRKKAWDAKSALDRQDEGAAKLVNDYMRDDYLKLSQLWQDQGFSTQELGSLGRHIRFGQEHDYDDMLRFDIDLIAENADKHARAGRIQAPQVGFENLLHPVVAEASLRHFQVGDYRNAVLDGMVALSDMIRERTGLDEDGKALATQAFSLSAPKLIFSELDTESGKNDQKGFMEMIAGAYMGIRNPKAHSLVHDLDVTKAGQYLVTISLLVRRVAEASRP